MIYDVANGRYYLFLGGFSRTTQRVVKLGQGHLTTSVYFDWGPEGVAV